MTFTVPPSGMGKLESQRQLHTKYVWLQLGIKRALSDTKSEESEMQSEETVKSQAERCILSKNSRRKLLEERLPCENCCILYTGTMPYGKDY